ncbi:MAG: TetR/AcrR family transcriptional regulator [Solirubrobacteraceae bacterium]|nr:TetR/AcrR family transcriptional regulator [Solirubrobacteraceae bacterium]
MSTPPRTTQSPRALGDDQARRLLRSGLERALEHESATQVSIDRLTQEAGVARSTFYVYFEDKGDFVSTLAAEAHAEVIGSADYWMGLSAPITKDDVREAVERMVDAFRTHYAAFVAVQELAAADARVRERAAAFLDDASTTMTAHITRGLAEGFVRPGVDAGRVALWLTLLLERGLHTLILPADADETDDYVAALVDIVWKSIYAGAA